MSEQRQQSTAVARRDPNERITGTFRDPDIVTARLQKAAKNYHLVSPAPACPKLPEGCSIMLSAVVVDPEKECYPVGQGKFALSKSSLEKLSSAAGISWDAQQSGRTDDGSDPRYCSWKAVGTMRHLDGTETQLMACKEMDMREGSDQVAKIEAEAAKNNRSAEPRIREMRAHIVAHAESKARLRAIRSMGIRSSYAKDEFQKPFVVAKLMWTGESDDPELRRAFALRQADAMLGGVKALYGSEPVPPKELPPVQKHPPPPVGSTQADDYDYDALQNDVANADTPPPHIDEDY